MLTALIATLSHLLLDWTNNYGVRPFFPVQSALVCGQLRVHRRAGDLGAACAGAGDALALWAGGRARLARASTAFRGRGWAIFALCGMVALWGWRWAEHDAGAGAAG